MRGLMDFIHFIGDLLLSIHGYQSEMSLGALKRLFFSKQAREYVIEGVFF